MPAILEAKLATAPSAQTTLYLSALAPREPAAPFDIITARLSYGSLAESNLIVTYPASTTDRNLPRVLTPTTPYALRHGSSATFGVALANGGDAIDVTQVDIEIPGGYDLWHNNGDGAPLFANELGPYMHPPTGWKWVDAKHIQWRAGTVAGVETPPEHVPALGAAFWAVEVKITDDTDVTTSIEPIYSEGPYARLTFENGHVAMARSWGKTPGVPSLLIPPASRGDDHPSGPSSDGYAWSANELAVGGERTFGATSTSTMAHLRGQGSYRVGADASDAVSLESAAGNATLQVFPRKLPIGSALRAEGDLSSLMDHLQRLDIPATLTLELYAPPSLGCKPTKSWSLDSRSLPTPAIRAVAIGGSQALPAVFALSADGNAYRIEPGLDLAGVPAWSTPVGTYRTLLQLMVLEQQEHVLVAGAGTLTLLHGATGEELWSADVGGDIATIAHDTASSRLFVGSGDTLHVRDPASGEPVHPTSRTFPGEVQDIIPTAAGVWVQYVGGYARLEDDLNVALSHSGNVVRIVPNERLLLVAYPSMVQVRDASTNAFRVTHELDRKVALSARGETTGDSVPDLALALDDARVFIVDGASGVPYVRPAPYTSGAGFTREDGWVPDATPLSSMGHPDVEPCARHPNSAAYSARRACYSDLAGAPTALIAGHGRTTLLSHTSGLAVLYHTTDVSMEWEHMPAPLGTAIATGEWLSNGHAVAYGSSEGVVSIFNDKGQEILTSTPSARAGRFTFFVDTPPGGFFGTHILVAKLAWVQGGQAQEARVFDWFEVVDAEGKPVLNPAYRVALVVQPRDGWT